MSGPGARPFGSGWYAGSLGRYLLVGLLACATLGPIVVILDGVPATLEEVIVGALAAGFFVILGIPLALMYLLIVRVGDSIFRLPRWIVVGGTVLPGLAFLVATMGTFGRSGPTIGDLPALFSLLIPWPVFGWLLRWPRTESVR